MNAHNVDASTKWLLIALFDYIGERITFDDARVNGWDNTLRHTITFLDEHGIEKEPVVKLLEGSGGFCDCEVLMNAADRLVKDYYCA